MLILLSVITFAVSAFFLIGILDELKCKRGGAAPLTFIWVCLMILLWGAVGGTSTTNAIKYSEWAQVSKGADYVVVHHSDFSTTLKDAASYNRLHNEEWVELGCEYNVNIYGGLVSIRRTVK